MHKASHLARKNGLEGIPKQVPDKHFWIRHVHQCSAVEPVEYRISLRAHENLLSVVLEAHVANLAVSLEFSRMQLWKSGIFGGEVFEVKAAFFCGELFDRGRSW